MEKLHANNPRLGIEPKPFRSAMGSFASVFASHRICWVIVQFRDKDVVRGNCHKIYTRRGPANKIYTRRGPANKIYTRRGPANKSGKALESRSMRGRRAHCTQSSLHTGLVAHRARCTQGSLHTELVAHRARCTQGQTLHIKRCLQIRVKTEI